MHTYPHKIENGEGEVLTFLGVVRDRGGDRMEVTGSIQGDVIFFAGERFDASQASLKKLTDMYEEVVNILTIVKSSGQAFSPDEWAALQKPALQRVSLASSRRK